MRTGHVVLAAATLLFAAVACTSEKAAPAKSEAAAGASAYVPTATIKDVMDGMVDPSADYLWQAVATVVSKAGIEERRPKTDDDWKMAKRRATTLVEATNVLLVPGRHVAKPGEKSENPNVELEPEVIESMLAKDRATWIKYVGGLREAATALFAATNDHNVQGLFENGEKLDMACENCHLHYWYPNEVIPPVPPPPDAAKPAPKTN
jgi:hypothetical protein